MNEKVQLIRTISNRLARALVILLSLFIPGALYAYLHPGSVIISTPLVAFVCGVIGGFVGLQRRLKMMSDDDLLLMANSWVYVCLSPLVGGVLAVITYILFISGLLAGDLFPKFVADPDVAVQKTKGLAVVFAIHGEYTDYAKMIFWCFIAGFSERFATDIISRFESEAKPASKPDA
ncbi:MAG: hypothetical protein WA496_09840 [Candidatus Udaeobacter sp.]